MLRIETTRDPEELTTQLTRFEPWGHRIDFSNGVSTTDLKRRTPFSENTVQKAALSLDRMSLDTMRGERLLDIGCNSGYNSIYAATQYGLVPTGIDVSRRHIEVSEMLSKMSDVEATFKLGNAETYLEEGQFQVVLHFGTLYHLPNPLLSLQSAFDNLKPGGWLALETQIYEGSDPNECYFMHMHNNDPTNFWALSSSVLKSYMEFIGFTEVEEILRVTPKILEKDGMHRTISLAKKPLTEPAS